MIPVVDVGNAEAYAEFDFDLNPTLNALQGQVYLRPPNRGGSMGVRGYRFYATATG